VKFVRYLNAGNYFGTDLNASLLRAGYDIEIANEGLLEELPRSNLITDESSIFPGPRSHSGLGSHGR